MWSAPNPQYLETVLTTNLKPRLDLTHPSLVRFTCSTLIFGVDPRLDVRSGAVMHKCGIESLRVYRHRITSRRLMQLHDIRR